MNKLETLVLTKTQEELLLAYRKIEQINENFADIVLYLNNNKDSLPTARSEVSVNELFSLVKSNEANQEDVLTLFNNIKVSVDALLNNKTA